MRVTQGMEQAQFLATINQLESSIATNQNHISSGLSFTTASQNPVGAGLVTGYNQALAQSQQYTTNGNSAQSSLNTEDNALTQLQNQLQSLRSLALEANNGTESQQDLSAIATQASQIQQSLLSLANTQDGSGNYIFGGFSTRDATVLPQRDRRDLQRRSGTAASPDRRRADGRRGRQRRSRVQPDQERQRYIQRHRGCRQYRYRRSRRNDRLEPDRIHRRTATRSISPRRMPTRSSIRPARP